MRFGCCVGPEGIEAAAEAGYDYVELPISVVLPERPEEAFAEVRARLAAAPLKPEVWRLHLPSDLRVTGPSVDWPRLARFAYTALRRAASLGGAVVTFCSGVARRVPDGFSRAEALHQVAEFLRICGTVARGHGMVVGVEPLTPEDTNLVNSLPEAMSLAKRVGLPEVGVTPNISAMLAQEQSLLDVADAAHWLAHVQVPASLAAREDCDRVMEELARALRLADYDWRISLSEGWGPGDAAKAAACLARLKPWFEDPDG